MLGSTRTSTGICIKRRKYVKECSHAFVYRYLYKEDNEEVEVCYPSELLKQILGDKIPNCILKLKKKKTSFRVYWDRIIATKGSFLLSKTEESNCKYIDGVLEVFKLLY